MRQLGVEMIFANSPQAKGRVERTNGTLQDRLVKALRIAGISTIQEANDFLQREFLPDYNRRFGNLACGAADMHRKVPPGLALAEVLCVQETRTVGRDWCVSYEGRVLQLDRRHEKLALAGRRITVLELAEGGLRLLYRGLRLRWRVVASRPIPQRELLQPVVPAPRKPRAQPWKPPADHPWRASFVKAAPRRESSLRSASPRSTALTKLAE
jgi:hypothetical protein